MYDVPWGYLAGVLLALVAVGVALRPPPTDGPRASPAFVLATASSEVPSAFLLLVVVSTVIAVVSGDLAAPAGLLAAGLAALAAAALVRVQVGAFAARPTVTASVDAASGQANGPSPRCARRSARGWWWLRCASRPAMST